MTVRIKTMRYDNVHFINGTAYAGKSTLVKLLAERFDGIACEENYHDALLEELDKNDFPCLTYTRDLQDWHDFIRRTPDEYERWVNGVTIECETLELRILDGLARQGKKVFVDTNVRVETLRKISDEKHVLIMLADPAVSVNRFFDRPDAEKQFLYRLMLEEPDPERALQNFRHCLERINSQKSCDAFLHSGFPVILRDENRSAEETCRLAAHIFGLE